MLMSDKPWWTRFVRTVDSGAETGSDPDGRNPGEPPADDQKDTDKTGDDALGEGGLKALKAERETNRQLKAQIAELSEKVKSFEDRDKSESEKQAEKLAAAEKRAIESGRKADQYEVAAAKGIPLSAASRLRGTTREEMEADADDLLKLLNINGGNSPKNHKPPKADPSQGKGGEAKPASLRDAVSSHYKH